MDKLRDTDDAKQILSLIQPLVNVDADKIRNDMYCIPATEMLHKCMYHETSIARKELDEDEEHEFITDQAERIRYNRTNRTSILQYMATNKITSSLGMIIYFLYISM